MAQKAMKAAAQAPKKAMKAMKAAPKKATKTMKAMKAYVFYGDEQEIQLDQATHRQLFHY